MAGIAGSDSNQSGISVTAAYDSQQAAQDDAVVNRQGAKSINASQGNAIAGDNNDLTVYSLDGELVKSAMGENTEVTKRAAETADNAVTAMEKVTLENTSGAFDLTENLTGKIADTFAAMAKAQTHAVDLVSESNGAVLSNNQAVLETISELGHTTATNGQSDTNQTIKWVVGIGAGLVALLALILIFFQKGKS